MFYLGEKLPVEEGDVLRGKIEVRRPREDVRSLRRDGCSDWSGPFLKERPHKLPFRVWLSIVIPYKIPLKSLWEYL